MKFTFVPYKGTQPALVDVGGGHVDLLLDSMIALQQLAKSGKVKPIAITSAKRSTLAPELPTVKEGGIADFSYVSWYGVWAPKGTPPERVAALNTAINAAVGEVGKSGAFAEPGHRAGDREPRAVQAIHRRRRGAGHRAAEERRLQARVGTRSNEDTRS